MNISQPFSSADNNRPQNGVPPSAEPASMLAAWQLNAQQQQDSDLRNLLLVVRRRFWAIAGVAAAVMTLTTINTFREEEVFRGQFRMLVEPVNEDNDFSELTSVLGEQSLSRSGLDYGTQVQVLRSPELIEPVAEDLNRRYPELNYQRLLNGLIISRVGDTKILEVSYTGLDPTQIQVVLDELAQTYLKYSLDERQTNLRQGINFVEAQVPDLQAEVDSLQDQLEAFRREYDFITPEAQSSMLSAQASGLNEQRIALDRELSEASLRLSSLDDQSGALAALDGAPVYQQLLSELRTVEVEIAEELTRFEPDSLAIRVLEEERANLLPLLEQEAQRVVGTKQAIAANNLKVMIEQSQTLLGAEQTATAQMETLPALIRQYTDLQRELEVSTEALTRFRMTLESLEIEAAQTEIPWQLIEVPVTSDVPISPNLSRSLLLGFVASILLGFGAALLLEKLDNVYHSVDELKAGTKLPLLGTLPHNKDIEDSRTVHKKGISALVESVSESSFSGRLRNSRSSYYGYGGNSESIFLEAVRVLHTNIRMLSSDRPIRSIVISSALPGDGKSTVSANLAQVATAMGQKVLIVDVDLRKPQVHDRLQIPNSVGLSNLIASNLKMEEVIQRLNPEQQLFALTAGQIPPDPTKLLASQTMKQLMDSFSQCFDLVIYDAPPATGLADVSLIGQQTDGLVLVTRMGKTDRTVLSQTVETLKLAQISTLGLVANDVKSVGLGGYRYYAYGYGTQPEMSEDGVEMSAVVGRGHGDDSSRF